MRFKWEGFRRASLCGLGRGEDNLDPLKVVLLNKNVELNKLRTCFLETFGWRATNVIHKFQVL
jgi:hypothetical protein